MTDGELCKSISGPFMPAGVGGFPKFCTFDRRFATTSFAPTTGNLFLTAILLPANLKVTGISFVSTATAESGGTHLWFALYKSDLRLMAQSADDTGATSFGATTMLRKTLTTPQVTPYGGLYYVGFMCSQSLGAVPTLLALATAHAGANGSVTGMTPIIAGVSTTGLGATAPNPAGAITPSVNNLFAVID